MKHVTMTQDIVRLVVPNILSNIAVPLLGMADVAIAGFCGGDQFIGAMAIGTMMFNMLYWNCAFLRMGASGVTAQSFGARDFHSCARHLLRGIIISLVLSLLLLIFKSPICNIAMVIMDGGEEINSLVYKYIDARYWAIPASLALFAINGWFIGMQDSKSPMYIAIFSNVVNIGLSAWLAISENMGIRGIALGTVGAQYFGLCMAAVIFFVKYKRLMPRVTLSSVLDAAQMKRFLSINADIFLRTLCIVIAFTTFTALAARQGDLILAAFTLLQQLLTLFSYAIDGLSYAAESLTGRFIGANERGNLKICIKKISLYALISALLFSAAYSLAWRQIFSLFSPSPETIECAKTFIFWIILMPLLSFFAYVADGIMIGATNSKVMRNTVAIALIINLLATFTTLPYLGPNAIWLGMSLFLSMRSILMIKPVKGLL